MASLSLPPPLAGVADWKIQSIFSPLGSEALSRLASSLISWGKWDQLSSVSLGAH